MSGFIYEWTNNINGKKYIGSHIGSIDDGYIGSGVIFNKAVKKYSITNFTRTILEIVDDNSLILQREQYYIDMFNVAESKQYYNVKSKAGGGWEHINENMNEDEKLNRIEHMKKIQPLSAKFAGKHHTEEAWQKTRTAWKTWAQEKLHRPVLQFDLNMNFLKEYESIQAAARAVNGNASNIKYTIEGSFSKAYGYKWKYKEKTNGSI